MSYLASNTSAAVKVSWMSTTNIHFPLPRDGMKSSWTRCADLTPGLDNTVNCKLFRHLLIHYDNNFGAAAKRQWTWRSNRASVDVSRYIALFLYIIIEIIVIVVTFQCRKKKSSSLFSNEMKVTVLWKWDRLLQVYIRDIYQLDAIFVYFSSTCFGLTRPSSGAIEL